MSSTFDHQLSAIIIRLLLFSKLITINIANQTKVTSSLSLPSLAMMTTTATGNIISPLPLPSSSSSSSSVSSVSLSPSTVSSPLASCVMNSTICSIGHFNRVCNSVTGRCECPKTEPIQLSSELPCLRGKHLGEICMHSAECNLTAHSICIASILFPIELLTVPNYRQWYIYNQITESSELNYILHKVYGRCRCRAGYRANKNKQCSPLNRETPMSCEQLDDCRIQKLNNSICNIQKGRCHCDNNFYYDSFKEKCNRVIIEFGQFCVTSSDCQITETRLVCQNQRCLCPNGYTYRLGIGCQSNCDLKQSNNNGNNTNPCLPRASTSSLTLTTIHSLLLKLLPIILIKLFVCNLIRFACYASARHNANDDDEEDEDVHPNGHSRTSGTLSTSDHCDLLSQNGQSRSLLSLPPYEVIMNEDYHQLQLDEHLPTYNEVMQDKENFILTEVDEIVNRNNAKVNDSNNNNNNNNKNACDGLSDSIV